MTCSPRPRPPPTPSPSSTPTGIPTCSPSECVRPRAQQHGYFRALIGSQPAPLRPATSALRQTHTGTAPHHQPALPLTLSDTPNLTQTQTTTRRSSPTPPSAPAHYLHHSFIVVTPDVQGMHKGCTKDAHRTNALPIPDSQATNRLAAPGGEALKASGRRNGSVAAELVPRNSPVQR